MHVQETKRLGFNVLYVDDSLLIGNNVGTLSSTMVWLCSQFGMKDLGEGSYIIGIKFLRNRKQRMFGIFQVAYINKILAGFNMDSCKGAQIPCRHRLSLSSKVCPKT
jgi:hypothetical protein